MAQRVAIVTGAQTKFEEEKPNQRFQEMVWEVVKKVREETGLGYGPEEIDNAVTCSDDFYDARTISDAPIGELVGAHYGPEEKVDQDGLQALFYAACTIAAGHSDITIVVGHCKESQSRRNMITHCAFDPIFSRQVGLDYLNSAALQARVYYECYGIKKECPARAVERDLNNALMNPYAQIHKRVSIDDVLSSPMICDPLRELEIAPQSDGAVAFILANESKAKKLTNKPVWIIGAGNCYDSYFLGDRNLWESKSLRFAARRAYKMAGIKNPKKELDLIELSAGYSYEELLFLEELGICKPGKAGEYIMRGATDIDGELPVNTSGGKISGSPYMVSGMARAMECMLQLQGRAGIRQIKGVKKALAHGTSGPAGQHHCVMIFSIE